MTSIKQLMLKAMVPIHKIQVRFKVYLILGIACIFFARSPTRAQDSVDSIMKIGVRLASSGQCGLRRANDSSAGSQRFANTF